MQKSASSRSVSALAGLLGLLYGASGAFIELDSALKRTFRVPPAPTRSIGAAFVGFLKDRAVGIALFGAFGAIVLASAVVGVVVDAVARASPVGAPAMWRAAEVLGSLALLTLALTLLFQGECRRKLRFWSIVPGAAITITLFYLLTRLFSLYVKNLTHYSAYGVVGAMFALALWITLACQLLLLGAQLTQVIAERGRWRRGSAHGMRGALSLPDDHGAVPRGRA
jgi:membrane protein